MDLKTLFKSDGNLNFDPRRVGSDDARYMTLFDEEGALLCGIDRKLKKLVKNNSWSPWCDAVGLVHAEQFSCGTKGNYTTIYYFR